MIAALIVIRCETCDIVDTVAHTCQTVIWIFDMQSRSYQTDMFKRDRSRSSECESSLSSELRMYVLTSLFLQTGDAALFNLSLLTSGVLSGWYTICTPYASPVFVVP